MIEDVITRCDYAIDKPYSSKVAISWGEQRDIRSIARSISLAELGKNEVKDDLHAVPVLGITGTGGAGKSSITDELVRRFLENYTDKNIAVISVDPSKKKTGGALLGDRIRMNSISSPRVYMRSLATRESEKSLSGVAKDAIAIC